MTYLWCEAANVVNATSVECVRLRARNRHDYRRIDDQPATNLHRGTEQRRDGGLITGSSRSVGAPIQLGAPADRTSQRAAERSRPHPAVARRQILVSDAMNEAHV